ncbi:MAG: hypothetical protein ACE5IM_08285 [Nitrospinota bacterium]
MSWTRAAFFLSCLGALTWLLAGCITADRITFRLEIKESRQGRFTFVACGLHSSERNPEERKKEFRDFVRTGYLEQGARLARTLGLQNPKIELFNKAEAKTDGRVSGNFENALMVLASFTEDGNFQIQRTGDRLSVELYKDRTETGRVTIQIRYAGKIISHNAHRYDAEAHLMEWDLERLEKRGLYFVLENL